VNPSKIENIQWVILDAMGVIYKTGDDTNNLLIPFVQNRNPSLSSSEINELYLKASLGEMSSEQFWKKVYAKGDCSKIERTYLDQCLEIDPMIIKFFSALKPKYRFGMLSNDVSEWSRYLRLKHGFNEWLEVVIVSGEIGIRKPDPKMYSVLLERIQADPSRCLFVDDREKNLIPAQELGFKTVLFSRQNGNDGVGEFQTVCSFADLTRILE
jgi:putative hydrolase of the HAD superfamily